MPCPNHQKLVNPDPAKYKHLWPGYIGNYGVPTFGDDLIILDTCKYCPLVSIKNSEKNYVLAKVPKDSASNDSIRVTLQSANSDILGLATKYAYSLYPPVQSDNLRIKIREIIDKYRSILDYLAHDIVSICSHVNTNSRNLYFPIALDRETKIAFEKRLEKIFPRLKQIAPGLHQYLCTIQQFSGSQWLKHLSTLANQNKHRQLIAWEEVKCHAIIVHHEGVGVRFGDLGLRSLTIPKGKSFDFESPDEIIRSVRGPQTIDTSTRTLIDADPDISLDILEWNTFGIQGTTRSAMVLLFEIDAGVRQACTEVTRYTSK